MQIPVVIVGAGPGGCGTSMFLAKYKIPHILLEKAIFPRDKICGDGLTPKVLHVLKKYNPDIAELFSENPKFQPIKGGIVTGPNGKTATFILANSEAIRSPMWSARRMDLDFFLTQQLQNGYAQLHQGVTITELEKSDEGIQITYQKNGETHYLLTNIVIAADGERSQVKRKFAPQPKEPAHFIVALRAYYRNIQQLHPDGYMEFFFLDSLMPGYFWIFPLADGSANVGAGILSEYVQDKKMNLREVMLKAIETHPSLKYRFSEAILQDKILGWGLPVGSKIGTLATERCLFVGDAASLIDPASGEGIGNALYSGMLAADAVAQALQVQNFSADFLEKTYSARVRRTMGWELKMSYRLQKLFAYPWLINTFIALSHRNPVIGEMTSYVFDDVKMRTQLRSPAFYWRLIKGFF